MHCTVSVSVSAERCELTFQLEHTLLAELRQSLSVLFQQGESETPASWWKPSLVHILNQSTPSSARTRHALLTWEEIGPRHGRLSQLTLRPCIT